MGKRAKEPTATATAAWRPLGRRRRLAWWLRPLTIAITAPVRWLRDRFRTKPLPPRRGPGNGPPPAGVREPRRPRPPVGSGAAARPWPPEE